MLFLDPHTTASTVLLLHYSSISPLHLTVPTTPHLHAAPPPFCTRLRLEPSLLHHTSRLPTLRRQLNHIPKPYILPNSSCPFLRHPASLLRIYSAISIQAAQHSSKTTQCVPRQPPLCPPCPSPLARSTTMPLPPPPPPPPPLPSLPASASPRRPPRLHVRSRRFRHVWRRSRRLPPCRRSLSRP